MVAPSSTTASPVKATLKRRAPKEPATSNKPSHESARNGSNSSEYDLPPDDKELSGSRKRAKTEDTKPSVKKPLRNDTASKNKTTGKRAPVQKVAPKKRSTAVIVQPSTKNDEARAASIRTRRTTKRPKYVEDSSDSEDETSHNPSPKETARNGRRSDAMPQELADDSYPLSKEALENVLQVSQVDFESYLEDLVPTSALNPQNNCIETPVAADTITTPKRSPMRPSEGPIPPVSEKLVRKTAIVHFDPQGPKNQAVPPRPTVEDEPESHSLVDENGQTHDVAGEESFRSVGLECSADDGPGQGEDGVNKDDQFSVIETGHGLITALGTSPENSTRDSSVLEDGSEHIETDESDDPVDDPGVLHKPEHPIQDVPIAVGLRSPPHKGKSITDSEASPKVIMRTVPTRRSIWLSPALDEEHTVSENVIISGRVPTSFALETEPRRGKTRDRDAELRQIALVGLETMKSTSVSGVAATAVDQTTDPNPPTRTSKTSRTSLWASEMVPMGPPPPRSIPHGSAIHTRLTDTITTIASKRFQLAAEETVTKPRKPAVPPPVRVKRAVPSNPVMEEPAVQPEADIPPATLLSFCTRLEMKAPALHDSVPDIDACMSTKEKVSAQQLEDGSLTLVDDHPTTGQRTALWARRAGRERPEPTDDASSVASPPRRRRNSALEEKEKSKQVHARDSQHGLLDSILQITNDVLFRLAEEEDAVKAKVKELYRGGDDIIQTLTDNWNERLGHEHQNLSGCLSGEKKMLTTAMQVVEEQDAGQWTSILCNPQVSRNTADKRGGLIGRIEALRKNRQ
ncbi:hypothetical protein KCU88_g2453, partial [Aureobasidium melanogenum]